MTCTFTREEISNAVHAEGDYFRLNRMIADVLIRRASRNTWNTPETIHDAYVDALKAINADERLGKGKATYAGGVVVLRFSFLPPRAMIACGVVVVQQADASFSVHTECRDGDGFYVCHGRYDLPIDEAIDEMIARCSSAGRMVGSQYFYG